MLTPRIKHITMALTCLLAPLIFSGCSHQPQQSTITAEEMTSVKISLREKIQQRGVQIVQQGSRLQLILPTDRFFKLEMTEIKSKQLHTLTLIAAFIKRYLTTHHSNGIITVTGYTDTIIPKQMSRKMSKKYADAIASYLWSRGLAEGQLKVVGKGTEHTISNPKTTAGSGDNRRVVIQIN